MPNISTIFGNNSSTKIINYFLQNPEVLHNLSSLAKELKISHVTISKCTKPLSQSGVLKTINIGRGTAISLNKDSEITKLLYKIEGIK